MQARISKVNNPEERNKLLKSLVKKKDLDLRD